MYYDYDTQKFYCSFVIFLFFSHLSLIFSWPCLNMFFCYAKIGLLYATYSMILVICFYMPSFVWARGGLIVC